MTSYEVRQLVKRATHNDLEKVYESEIKRYAEKEFERLCKEHSDEYFELVAVVHTEQCLVFYPGKDRKDADMNTKIGESATPPCSAFKEACERTIKYLREIGESTRGESVFPSAEYADAIADGLEYALKPNAGGHDASEAR